KALLLRRIFLSLLPSTVTVASAASAVQPVSAQQGGSTPMNRMQPFPEPDLIVIDSATMDRGRALLDAVTRGTFDRSELAPELEAFVPPSAFASAPALLEPLGTPQSIFAFEKSITAYQTSTYFRVHYPNQILTWVVSVGANNRITGLSLRHSLTNLIFSVVSRNIQY
ncbi:MAG TPA: hypothetical protein VHS56_10285, partial [Candidatus Cybelea sp.]|nr:hypothetical protein [Candidatus Cybelea sp.]